MIATCIYDTVSCTFTPFATTNNEELAIRQFKTSALGNKMILLNPSDFELFKVADFDEASGIYTTCPHKKLCCANDFKSFLGGNEGEI